MRSLLSSLLPSPSQLNTASAAAGLIQRKGGALPALVGAALVLAVAATPTWAATPAPKAAPKKPPAKKTAPVRSLPKPLVGSGPSYAERPEAQAFAQELAQRRQLPLGWLQAALAEARQSPTVIKLSLPPSSPTVKNWRVYRSRFLDEPRIQAGLAFWQAHAADLARAEKTYGVPAEIVVGILGVETIYGREMGRFRVLDALSTLAFDFPEQHPRAAERSAFFRKELEHFLVEQHRTRAKPGAALGSYAGAAGLPQFMPSSRAHFAVDFDRDGRIDLARSTSDAIGSVAHYLQAFNWQRGMATHYPVAFDSARLDMDALMAPDILPTFSVASFGAKGAVLEGEALAHPGPLALIELLNGGDTPSYVAGTENFYAITRYNWSSYYAMAVIDLGRAVAERRRETAHARLASKND